MLTLILVANPSSQLEINVDAKSGFSISWIPTIAFGSQNSELDEDTKLNLQKAYDELKIKKDTIKGNQELIDKISLELKTLSNLNGTDSVIIKNIQFLDSEKNNLSLQIESQTSELYLLSASYEKQFKNIKIVTNNQEDIKKITAELEQITSSAIELDKKIYSWTEQIRISITDPLANSDPNKIETIGLDDSSNVEISSEGLYLSNYPLIETSSNSGIFFGLVQLTGFSDYDANNDGVKNDAIGQLDHTGKQSSGQLPVFPNNDIIVKYHRNTDEIITSSALVRWNLGEAFFGDVYIDSEKTVNFRPYPTEYSLVDSPTIVVNDLDLNIRPTEKDSVVVKVFSDSDPNGIFVTLTETTENSSYFTGRMYFGFEETKISNNVLKSSTGDTITLVYLDKTLPNPYEVGDELKITYSINLEKFEFK